MNKKLENIKACKLKKNGKKTIREQQWPVLHWGKKKRFVERKDKEINLGEGDMEARAGWRIEEIVWKIKNISVGFFLNS